MQASLPFLRALAVVGILGVLAVATNTAHAQVRDPVTATELFTQGRELIKQGDLDKACALFAESLRLDPAVGTALNLAECEERRRHLTRALRSWQQAVNLAEATQDERGRVARERLEALSPRVPRLTVLLGPDAPDDTVVLRENVRLGDATLGRPLPVDPGKHVITIRAPGHEDAQQVVMLQEGEAKTIRVSPGAPIDTTAASATEPLVVDDGVDDGSSQRTMAYVLGGVGAAGMLVAAVSGVVLLNERKVVDDSCDDRNRCTQTGLDAADNGKLLVPINTVAWAVGVAGLGAGAYLYFTAPPVDAHDPNAGALRPNGAYLQVQGAF